MVTPVAHTFFVSQQFGMITNGTVPTRTNRITFRNVEIQVLPPFRLGAPQFRGRPVFSQGNVGVAIRTTGKIKVIDPAVVPNLGSDGSLSFTLIDASNRPKINEFPDSFAIVVEISDLGHASTIGHHFIDRLFVWLRVVSMQYWMGRSMGRGGGIFHNLPLGSDGKMDAKEVNQSTDPVYAGSLGWAPIDDELWSYCIDAAASDQLPDSTLILISDLDYLIASDSISSAIVVGCSIVEQTRDLLLERKEIRPFRDTKLTRHLGTDFGRLFGRNLQHDDPILYEQLRKLWSVRNNIAHGKPYKDLYPVGALDLAELELDVGNVVRLVSAWIEAID